VPKWLAPVLILFLAFFILSNPEQAGPQTRSFFSWIGDQGESAGKFITGLIGDESESEGGDGGSTNNFGTGQTPTPAGQGDGSIPEDPDVGSFVEDGTNAFDSP